MKTTNFKEQIDSAVNKAHAFIKNNLEVGKKIRLVSTSEVDEGTDEFYELPTAFIVGDHGEYDEYAIVALKKKKNGEVECYGEGKGDTFGNTYTFDLPNLNPETICTLADLLSEKL